MCTWFVSNSPQKCGHRTDASSFSENGVPLFFFCSGPPMPTR